MGIEVMKRYARSLGELTPNCVTDFSVHCFNSATLEVLQSLGVRRATLHPELNLAQIRDLKKCIDTEIIIYGKIPLMEIKNPQVEGILTDRKGAKFFMHGDFLFNSVPIFVADKLNEVEKSGITHGRLIFTTEDENETRSIIKANMKRKAIKLDFTRGKFFSKV
jgi:putative protease